MSSLAHDPIEMDMAARVFLSVVLIVGVCGVIGYFTVKKLGLPVKVYLPPMMFANTGNMGLPLMYFAFGEFGFTIGILYMVSTTMLHYTAGILILNYDDRPFEIFRLPLVYSAGAGVLLSVYEIEIPIALYRAVDLLGEASIPAMIFALGYKLAEVKMSNAWKSFLTGGMRVAIGVSVGILAVYLFDLSGIVARVVILQSAMPPAVFNFVIGENYNQDSKTVASIILAGTIVSVFSTPLILAFLLN